MKKNDIITTLQKTSEEVTPPSELLERGKEHLRIRALSTAQTSPTPHGKTQKKLPLNRTVHVRWALALVLFLGIVAAIQLPGLQAVRQRIQEMLPKFLSGQAPTLLGDFASQNNAIQEVALRAESNDVPDQRDTQETQKEFSFMSTADKGTAQSAVITTNQSTSSDKIAGKPSTIETQKQIVSIPQETKEGASIEQKSNKTGDASTSTQQKETNKKEH